MTSSNTSLPFLCDLVERFGKQNIGFKSITDGIDTLTSSGKLVFHIIGALAEFERDLIRERTKSGMKAAKKRGKHVGRPKSLSKSQVNHALTLLELGNNAVKPAIWAGYHFITII